MLTKRQTTILRKIAESETGVSRESLAKSYEVSTRTIRNEIQVINEFLSQGNLGLEYRDRRYSIPVGQREPLMELLEKELSHTQIMPQNVCERHIYLLIELFAAPEPLRMYELSEEIFVSRSTLTLDAKAISARFPANGELELFAANGTLQLVGPEHKKRDLIYRLLCENPSQEMEYILDVMENFGFFSEEQYLHLFDYLVQSLEALGIMLSDSSLNCLVIMLLISADRIKNGEEITRCVSELQPGFPLDTNALARFLGISYSPAELSWITTLINRCRILSYASKQSSTEAVAHAITSSFLEETIQNYSLPETLFEPYRQDLENHIRTMITRVMYHATDDMAGMTEFIKNKYPLAYEISTGILPILQQYLHITVPETELYYIAMHIAVVFEDNRSKIDVILLCGSSMTTAHLLERRLKDAFATKIHIVGTYPQYMLKTVLKENPNTDLILSTVPMKGESTVPVVEISPLLSESDICRIERYTSRMFYRGRSGLLPPDQPAYFDRSLFHIFSAGADARQIVAVLSQKMAGAGVIDDPAGFCELVFERERLHSTRFGGVWIPHPMRCVGNKSAVAIGILPQSRQLVFLVSTLRGESVRFAPLYDKLLELIDSPQLVEELCRSTDYNSFISKFQHI